MISNQYPIEVANDVAPIQYSTNSIKVTNNTGYTLYYNCTRYREGRIWSISDRITYANFPLEVMHGSTVIFFLATNATTVNGELTYTSTSLTNSRFSYYAGSGDSYVMNSYNHLSHTNAKALMLVINGDGDITIGYNTEA